MPKKQCTACLELRSLDEYYQHRGKPHAYPICKTCARYRSRESYRMKKYSEPWNFGPSAGEKIDFTIPEDAPLLNKNRLAIGMMRAYVETCPDGTEIKVKVFDASTQKKGENPYPIGMKKEGYGQLLVWIPDKHGIMEMFLDDELAARLITREELIVSKEDLYEKIQMKNEKNRR